MPDVDRMMNNISLRIKNIVFSKLRYSQNLYEELINSHVNENTVWLDLGCGHQLLPEWRKEQEKILAGTGQQIVGLDYDFGSLHKHATIADLVRGDISALPFRDNSFNLITSNMVMEHAEYPESVFKEIRRILLPGGKFIFHTPNLYGYNTVAARMIPEAIKPIFVKLLHGRGEDDTFLTFYRCNTEKKIKDLAEKTNLEVHKIKFILSTPQFMIFPPFAFLELLFLKLLNTSAFRKYRINIIAILEKGQVNHQ